MREHDRLAVAVRCEKIGVVDVDGCGEDSDCRRDISDFFCSSPAPVSGAFAKQHSWSICGSRPGNAETHSAAHPVLLVGSGLARYAVSKMGSDGHEATQDW
ncbi:hypothetical protein ACFIOY_24505 [Bradyrhizobium sp. TZ2]